MGFYNRHIMPRLVAISCGAGAVTEKRRAIVPQAEGVVLEIGVGPGHNLPLYDPGRVTKLYALEPDPTMRRLAARRVAAAPFEIDWLDLPGEAIPLDPASVDTVVLTYTLCTIPDPVRALDGMRRVLRPGGRLLFCEHGAAPDPGVRRWQDRLNGVSRCLAGGCNLNRVPDDEIASAGFAIDRLETGYLAGAPKVGGYTYLGAARPA